jgi:hypothetical protein
MSRIRKHVRICQRKSNRLSSISSKKHNMCASSPMRQLASFFGKLVVGISSYTVCDWSISQPGINYLLSSNIATVMGNRLQVPDAGCSRRSWVLTKNTLQYATTSLSSWLSSKLDGITPLFAPLLPEGLHLINRVELNCSLTFAVAIFFCLSVPAVSASLVTSRPLQENTSDVRRTAHSLRLPCNPFMTSGGSL